MVTKKSITPSITIYTLSRFMIWQIKIMLTSGICVLIMITVLHIVGYDFIEHNNTKLAQAINIEKNVDDKFFDNIYYESFKDTIHHNYNHQVFNDTVKYMLSQCNGEEYFVTMRITFPKYWDREYVTTIYPQIKAITNFLEKYYIKNFAQMLENNNAFTSSFNDMQPYSSKINIYVANYEQRKNITSTIYYGVVGVSTLLVDIRDVININN